MACLVPTNLAALEPAQQDLGLAPHLALVWELEPPLVVCLAASQLNQASTSILLELLEVSPPPSHYPSFCGSSCWNIEMNDTFFLLIFFLICEPVELVSCHLISVLFIVSSFVDLAFQMCTSNWFVSFIVDLSFPMHVLLIFLVLVLIWHFTWMSDSCA